MERIRNALCYYGNKGSYESLPTGSVFTRLRGPRPTTHQLTFAAQLLLREIDQMRESK